MAGTGGRRPGAGRPKGVPNKRTAETQKKVEASGLTPLDYMLSVMRNKKNETGVRMEAAKAAAPYVHAKLATVDLNHQGDMSLTVELINYADTETGGGDEAADGEDPASV